MGYRSDVAYTIRFNKVEDYHLFILEAKANPETAGCFPPNNDGTWEECTCDEERKRIDFSVQDVKWYEYYPDVQMHEKLLALADEWIDSDNHVSVREGTLEASIQPYRIGYVYVRVGEDVHDVERKEGGNAEWDWLHVRREIVEG